MELKLTTNEAELLYFMVVNPEPLLYRGKKNERGAPGEAFPVKDDASRLIFLRLHRWVVKHAPLKEGKLPKHAVEYILDMMKHYQNITSVMPFVDSYITLKYKLENDGKELAIGEFEDT